MEGKRSAPLEGQAEKARAEIGRFLAVMSGKGGVGKSSLTAMLAVGMQRKGRAVGVLDADITGPSIPRIMGVRGRVWVEDDAPLTIVQMLPTTDVLIVTSPQVLASMIVRKAINMARRVGARVIGVVENMGEARCPHCGETFELFRGEGTDQMVREMGLPLLGKIPYDSRIGELCDHGAVETYESEAVNGLVSAVLEISGG